MFKFLFKLKKPLFLTHFHNLGVKSVFQKNMAVIKKLQMNFQHHAKIQRNLMIQFRENTWTDGRTEGQTDLISLGPFQLLWGVQQVQLLDNGI